MTVSVDGGVDTKSATYGVYASMTGGDSVKLNAGDSAVTFTNGITVNFDKLTSTDTAVSSVSTGNYNYTVTGGSALNVTSAFSGAATTTGYSYAVTGGSAVDIAAAFGNTASSTSYSHAVTGGSAVDIGAAFGNTASSTSYSYAVTGSSLDITNAFTGAASDTTYSYAVAGGSLDVSSAFSGESGTLTLAVTGGALADGGSNLTAVSVQSIADNGTDATITLTDGNQTYTATVTYAAMQADISSTPVALTFTAGSGDTLSATLGSSADETSSTIGFTATIGTGDVATITSTGTTVDSTINLTVTGGTLNDGSANLSAISMSSVADNGDGTATFTLTDGTNSYTSTVDYDDLATLDGSNTITANFTGSAGSLTATIGSTTDQTGETFTFGADISSGNVATVASTGTTTASEISLTVSAGTLTAGAADLSGNVTVSGVADNGDGSAAITLSDGTNSYTANVDYSDLEALTADGSNDISLTFTGSAGSFTASISTDTNQSASGINFNATTTTGTVANRCQHRHHFRQRD